MASPPNVFEISDPDNGKVYRIEADPGVSQEEALLDFESLEKDQRAAFEFKPKPVPVKQESAPAKVNTPAPVAVSANDGEGQWVDVTNDPQHTQAVQKANAPKAPPLTYEQALAWAEQRVPQDTADYALGMDTIGQEDPDQSPRFVSRDEKILLAMANNPQVSLEDLNKFITSRDKLPFSAEQLEEVRIAREKGVPYGSLDYENPAEELLGGYGEMEDPTVGGFGAGLELGMAENPMGVAQRALEDLFDVDQGGITDEMLESRYPGITEEGKETIRDLLMGELRRRELGNARYQVDVKNVGLGTELFTGFVAGTSPIDLIPLGKGATFGRRAGEAFFFNQATDAIMQGQDISYGAQDEFDPVRSAMAGVTGAAVQGAIEVPLNIATRLGFASRMNRPDGRLPMPLEPLDQTIPSRTTSDRRTKTYKVETQQAVEAVQARADDIAVEWTNAPEVRAVDSFSDVAGLENDALGVYRSDGSVLLNTEAILRFSSTHDLVPDDVVRSVMFHEGLGHHGLASKYGEDLEILMADIYENGDIAVKRRVDEWMARYESDDIALATEEVLAEMSESGQLPTSIIQRLYAHIKNFARRIGFSPKYTTSELRSILAVAQREVTGGAPNTGGGYSDKYKIVYHGSGADFDQFDHSYMGTGEGMQVFGWGTYLTENQRIGEGYRDAIGGTSATWNGMEVTWWQARQNLDHAVEQAFPDKADSAKFIANQVIDYRANRKNVPPTPADVIEHIKQGHDAYDFPESTAEDLKLMEELAGDIEDVVKFTNDRFDVKTKGKLYEVDIPDDVNYIEWEVPIKEQHDLDRELERSGFTVTSYDYWNQVQRQAYQARATYDNLSSRLDEMNNILLEASENQKKTGEFFVSQRNHRTLQMERRPMSFEEVQQMTKDADDVFEKLQEASLERTKAVKRAERFLHENMEGATVYNSLSIALGGPKEASEFLKGLGFEGNRYLANNYTAGAGRKNDGTDQFNYVMFDDKTPKIVNKYMRPYSYESGKGELDIASLNSEELFEAENAFDILDRLVPRGVRSAMTMEELEADAAMRKVPPSALLRLSEKDPGYLARSLFMHDIALTKMGERVARLTAKINSGNYTMDDKANFLTTIARYEELTERIFGMGSEFGLALRAMQNVTYTRKNLTTIRDSLKGVKNGEAFHGLDDPETFERFARSLGTEITEAAGKVNKGANPVLSVLNIPRALMSSMDLSAPLRQGIFFVGSKEYNNAFLEMHNLFLKDEEYYDALMSGIQNRPTYKAMIEGKVAFSSIDESAPLSAREEDFATSLANSVPGVARSNRAFSGFRNQLSADMFDKYYQIAEEAGADMSDPQVLQSIGALVNAGTGRGNLPAFLQSSAPLLNSLFFSPRLFFSRVHLINPATYYRLPPGVRKAAITRAASVGTAYTMLLSSLAYFFPDIDVEADPRKSDFGKVRVGDTRFDVLGGFGQYITLGARLATGQKVSSADRVSNLSTAPFLTSIHEALRESLIYAGVGEEESYQAAPVTPFDNESVIGAFMENKFSPNFSYLWDMGEGKNFEGEPFDPIDEALARVTPLYFQDMAELHSEAGPGDIAKGFGTIAGLYGVGTSTYVSRSLDPNQELEAPETMTDKNLADGENEWVTVKDGDITLKPKARELYSNRINTYFSQIMEYEISQSEWTELEDSTKAKKVREAKDEARREARKDVRIIFGID